MSFPFFALNKKPLAIGVKSPYFISIRVEILNKGLIMIIDINTVMSVAEFRETFPETPVQFIRYSRELMHTLNDISFEINEDSLYINHKGSAMLMWGEWQKTGTIYEYMEESITSMIAMRYGAICQTAELKKQLDK